MTSAGLPPKPMSMGTVARETNQGTSQRSQMRQRKIVGRASALKSLESYILSPAQSLPDLANMSLEREEEAMHSLRQEHNFIANSPTIFKAGRPSLSPEDSGQNSSFSNNSSTLLSALSPETPDSALIGHTKTITTPRAMVALTIPRPRPTTEVSRQFLLNDPEKKNGKIKQDVFQRRKWVHVEIGE